MSTCINKGFDEGCISSTELSPIADAQVCSQTVIYCYLSCAVSYQSFQSLTKEPAIHIFLINTNNQCCNYVPSQNISLGKVSVLLASPHFILFIGTTISSEVGEHQDSTLSPKKAFHPIILDNIGWLYSVPN